MRDINFFSEQLKKNSASRKKKSLGLVGLILIVCIFAGTYILTAFMIKGYKDDINTAKNYLESEEVRQKKQELDAIKQKSDILVRYQKVINNIILALEQEDRINSTLIEEFNKVIPRDVMIKSIVIASSGIKLSGTAANRISIAEFEHNLIDLDYFKEIHVGTIRSTKKDSTSSEFDIDCVLKDVMSQ